jgi:WD40 repeat protein
MTYIAARPSGELLAVASDSGWIGVWMPIDNRVVAVQQTGGFVNRVGWTSDGKRLLATTNDDSILVYSGDGTRLESTIKGHGGLRTFAMHPSQPKVASIGNDGVARVWDVTSGAKLLEVGQSDYGGKSVGLSETAVICGYGSGWFAVFDHAGENQARGELFAGETSAIGVAPGGKSVVLGGSRGRLIEVIEADGKWRTGTVWSSQPPKGISTNAIEFAPDGRFVAAHSDDTAYLFSSTNDIVGRGLGSAFWIGRKTPWEQKFIVSAACFVPGTQVVATSHFTGAVKLWNKTRLREFSVRFVDDQPMWNDWEDKPVADPIAAWNELVRDP